jgi:hypothetical protein
MAIFKPPTDNLLTYIDRNQPYGLGYRLFRFYNAEPRGRNVFKLTDGSFVETDPADFNSIAKLYFGGHENVVDAQEVADLTAAGYGEYIS